MNPRRHFLRLSGAAPVLGLLGGATLLGQMRNGQAANADYRAVICLFLNGGNDGNNTLVPLDGAFGDYASARPELALAKDSLAKLNGSSAGHTFGLHPALAPLATLYNQGRLAWIANAGPLVKPATAQQVLQQAVQVPSFLLSHSDQTMWQQGWMGDADGSGWAGRSLEYFPTSLRNSINAVTMSNDRTLVLGRNSPVSFLSGGDARYWGAGDLAQPQAPATQAMNRMAKWQFSNQYEAEYAATFGRSVSDSTLFTQAALLAKAPAADFADNPLANNLKKLASLLPVFKSLGYKRQVFMVQWGEFDTHTAQRGGGATSQDTQLDVMARALAAFDKANLAAGMDQNVVTLMMSDFGRTLRQASGGGTDHAWGNHWFAMGGPVAGGQVLGTFPALVPGGVDDMDKDKAGRWVPTTSTDQIGASVMQWMGLAPGDITSAFPHLANFTQKTLGFLRS
ncbi:DUF1501 domain-containing protein [Pseudoduganella sp. FT25W]|jgi:uncharacterized protein (DUF1501 family)|uniref:DUF1501 domain-containing protein n=1 Tax=Duganella alba TaxID=2666081 RepID=A0A6L5QEV0_9BURK|nr:DUF1501 domain-containing protein [Duganella alba]MRX08246.1 DUF1501 domain-containing protein [Duganella alba]MRX16785.1 DUF1501 domain-containing protein [Duganella alba]